MRMMTRMMTCMYDDNDDGGLYVYDDDDDDNLNARDILLHLLLNRREH